MWKCDLCVLLNPFLSSPLVSMQSNLLVYQGLVGFVRFDLSISFCPNHEDKTLSVISHFDEILGVWHSDTDVACTSGNNGLGRGPAPSRGTGSISQ